MDELLEIATQWQRTFAPVELLPAYCGVGTCFVLAWVVSTPLRNVDGTFAGEVWRVMSLNGSLWNDYLHQYNKVLLNSEVRQLRGLTYVYAPWEAVFAVPVQVLADNEQHYGDYGRMLRKWWIATYTTFDAFLPDLGLNTACSVRNCAIATKGAVVACLRRLGEALRVALLVIRFLLALAFFAPMAAYDLVEFAFLGEAGVTLALTALNRTNYIFDWTTMSTPGSVIFVVVGIVAHI
ncbi:unnamed protein product [Phytophthora fragariaefolia]|uniref:Unnamed protein product n=1 Tax=Phytophthora fragariaefolia TaxID=1490495 RepID=A0A9W6Y0D0_9STRA|nr:unnamed protein product [Phytophthora fragariaefolia]